MPSASPETRRRKPRDRSERDQTGPALERVVYTVPEAGRLLGLSRNGSYEAAKRGDIPTIRIGRLLLVPKARFHRMLDAADSSVAEPTAKEGGEQ